MQLRRNPEALARLLAEVKAAAFGRIAARVGEVRVGFVTDLPGQEMVYIDKEAQAAEFLADPAGAVPRAIAGEVGITAETPEQVAQVVLNLADRWRDVSPLIERARLDAGNRIAAAVSLAGVAEAEAAGLAALDEIERGA